MEMDADVLVKATKVDAIYDSDPFKNPEAKRFSNLTYYDSVVRAPYHVCTLASLAARYILNLSLKNFE